jgi:Staphylococcal nuclease homologue
MGRSLNDNRPHWRTGASRLDHGTRDRYSRRRHPNNPDYRTTSRGIDTPEKCQPFGQVAKDHFSSLVDGQTVNYLKRDHYGRIVGKLLTSGSDAGLRQVEALPHPGVGASSSPLAP